MGKIKGEQLSITINEIYLWELFHIITMSNVTHTNYFTTVLQTANIVLVFFK